MLCINRSTGKALIKRKQPRAVFNLSFVVVNYYVPGPYSRVHLCEHNEFERVVVTLHVLHALYCVDESAAVISNLWDHIH